MRIWSRRVALKVGGGLFAGLLASPARSQPALDGLRGALDAGAEGLRAGAVDDQSAILERALLKAEANGQPLFLPPGRYEVARIALPRRAILIGVAGGSILAFRGGPFMMRGEASALLRLQGLTLDGMVRPLDPASPALLDVDGADDLAIEDCRFAGSIGGGVRIRAGAGRIAASRFADAGSVGIELVQSRGMLVADNVVVDCGDTGILVERDDPGSDDTIVRGNRVSRIRADSGGTGQYGNGINVSKADSVLVASNRVDNCAFSAVRCFSSDNVQVAGNTLTASGEMAVYVEFASEGAIVSGNLVDGGNGGISFANFQEHGGRLAVCSGNLVRNIRGGPRYADGVPQTGAGIGAEADIAISGNVIENARQGLQLGWGPYLRDVAATGNVIRDCPIGIAASVADGAGAALIAANLISGAGRGAILGMRWEESATTDLSVSGAEAFPQLTIQGNRVG